MEQTTKQIMVQSVALKSMKVTVAGDSLICHRLNGEQVEKFMSRETGKVQKKELRVYDDEYKSCFYLSRSGKYGFPVSGFMGAILDCAVALDIPKTQIKRSIRLVGDIAELRYKEIIHRVDYPRRGGINKTPDTRHRPEFVDWECDLIINYDANQISPEQVINLINQAGFSSGIGDWRPSAPKSSGSHGMFKVKGTR